MYAVTCASVLDSGSQVVFIANPFLYVQLSIDDVLVVDPKPEVLNHSSAILLQQPKIQ
ncbi:hypothetical protein RchiOBHm_Chr4g0385241 [Rosa chinensis]|uniref:Uncharacterized protein n=1 Tax=Rosa chinensis TaxID=74649 RepID=A0A2P6QNW7_ROSCH|nr:hypothetical protein RchiOBHm_Chr4g0385241 [Rosa chinensis]